MYRFHMDKPVRVSDYRCPACGGKLHGWSLGYRETGHARAPVKVVRQDAKKARAPERVGTTRLSR